MEKVSFGATNRFCPQALYLYGTYKEDGSANLGTHCWFGFCWDDELSVMACISDGKLTIDRIRSEKVFSANLVSEAMIPLADYLGYTEGYTPGKMDISIEVERGTVLPVPILKDSPLTFELEVKQSLPLGGSELFICRIRNVLAMKELMDESRDAEELMQLAAPVVWAGADINRYFSVNPVVKGVAESWKDLFGAKENLP